MFDSATRLYYFGNFGKIFYVVTSFFFPQTSDDTSNSSHALPSFLFTSVPCQKWMAGERLFCCGSDGC